MNQSNQIINNSLFSLENNTCGDNLLSLDGLFSLENNRSLCCEVCTISSPILTHGLCESCVIDPRCVECDIVCLPESLFRGYCRVCFSGSKSNIPKVNFVDGLTTLRKVDVIPEVIPTPDQLSTLKSIHEEMRHNFFSICFHCAAEYSTFFSEQYCSARCEHEQYDITRELMNRVHDSNDGDCYDYTDYTDCDDYYDYDDHYDYDDDDDEDYYYDNSGDCQYCGNAIPDGYCYDCCPRNVADLIYCSNCDHDERFCKCL